MTADHCLFATMGLILAVAWLTGEPPRKGD